MPRTRSPSKRGKAEEEETGVEQASVRSSEPKCRQCVMFMKDSLLSSSDAQVIKLRHPRSNQSSMFVYDKGNGKLLEMMTFDEEHRSWFIGETVQSDGRLYIISPVDVTYLVLPYLMKADKNVPLDHLLEDTDYPAISHLAAVATSKDFSHVADRKGNPELGVWKYNEDLTLSWLEERVRKLSALLQEKKVPTSSAQSFTYVRTMDMAQTKEAYLVLAHGIISEYLNEDLSKALHKHLNLPDMSKIKQKTSKGIENLPPTKKQKIEGPTEDYTINSVKVEKVKAQSAKEKALAKSAAGSKSITSFFSKK